MDNTVKYICDKFQSYCVFRIIFIKSYIHFTQSQSVDLNEQIYEAIYLQFTTLKCIVFVSCTYNTHDVDCWAEQRDLMYSNAYPWVYILPMKVTLFVYSLISCMKMACAHEARYLHNLGLKVCS